MCVCVLKYWSTNVLFLRTLNTRLVGSGGSLGLAVMMIQLDEREEEDGEHHGEGAGVVGKRGWNESIVLNVLEWTHWHLSGREEIGVADAVVLDIEFVNAVHVWYLELSGEDTTSARFQCLSHERIQSDKLKLNVGVLKRLPFTIDYFFDLDRVDQILFDCVGSWWGLLAY